LKAAVADELLHPLTADYKMPCGNPLWSLPTGAAQAVDKRPQLCHHRKLASHLLELASELPLGNFAALAITAILSAASLSCCGLWAG